MKIKMLLIAGGLALLAGTGISFAQNHQGNASANSQPGEIFYADPTVFVENGKYYLCGTRDSRPAGFALIESTDLVNWKYANPTDSLILRVDPSLNYGSHGFWAPQFYKTPDGKYQIFYTANEQVAVADCDNIAGRYTTSKPEPVDGSAHNIDPFLFRDEDGKYYLYHVRFDHGNFIWVAEYDPATREIRKETLKQCFANTQPWEKTDAYPCDPIMEGPGVVKIGDTYYLFYSCNHFLSPDYAVGYATAPTPLGPWTKNPNNPIINKEIVGEKGSGHGDVFRIPGEENKLGYVYHVHNSDSVATPRRTRILTLNLTPNKKKKEIFDITADPSSIIKPKLDRRERARFNVASYNLRQQNHSDSVAGNGWGRRLPHLADLIRFHEFDIFGTQEGYKNQLEELNALLPGYAYVGVGREDGIDQGEHSAIFYRTDLFDVLDKGDFWLSETPDVPSIGWDAVLPRICSWAHFRDKKSGKEFLFFNLHMDHIGKQARVESGKLVKQKCKELGKGIPAFLTGDFNVDQTHESYRTLTSDNGFEDSFETTEFRYAPNGTYNCYETDGFTEERIDHIFVTPGVRVEKYGVLTDTYRTPAKESGKTLADGKYESRVPSDHFPVKVTVSF